MARRRIGQEQLAVGGSEPRRGTSLDEVAALVDWAELDRLLAGISAAAKGEPGWPPLALFQAVLLATGTASPCLPPADRFAMARPFGRAPGRSAE